MLERPSSEAGRLAGRSLAVYLPDLSGGGTERLHLALAPAFREAGLSVTLLLDRRRGELLDVVPPGIAVETLDAPRQIRALPRLVAYLRRARPDILVANTEHMNVMALLARRLAGVGTRVVACQHNALSAQAVRPGWQFRILPALSRRVLPRADAVVAVSRGVADDMAAVAGLDRDRITVVYNGAIGPDFDARAAEPAVHPWLGSGEPLVVAVGRMVAQKDYPTLLEAFAGVVRRRPARLVILGEGPLRADLAALALRLGISERVDMPGFAANPLPLMRAADALVLASRFEGFGLVLAEALALGTPVVSADCPHGPAEILEGGRYGPLVPVGDPPALAEAILSVLDASPDRDALRARGRSFSIPACARGYLDLFGTLLAEAPRPGA